MTEYIDIRAEPSDDPEMMVIVTNLDLTSGGPPESSMAPRMRR